MNESTRYPIAAIRERVRLHNGPVLDFAVGPHREDPPASVRELLGERGRRLPLTRASAAEIEELSEAAAAMMRRVYGVETSPTSILSVPGGRTAMSFLASTLIRPGDDVAVVEPCYPAFNRVAHQIHARVHSVPMDPARGFGPVTESLTPEDRSIVSFVALNYPNNPTGAVLSSDSLRDFLGGFGSDTIVFNDATYGPLVFDRPPWSLLAEAGGTVGDRRFVELQSLAKLFALGPLSVAFLVGDESIMADLREYSEYAWSDQSSLNVQVALRCLSDGDRFDYVRKVFSDRLGRLRSTLEGLGFDPVPAESGMYIVCRTPSAIGGAPVADAQQAADVLLRNHNVATVPWEVHPTSYLRFSSQYLEEDLAALQRLGRHGPLAKP
jgi:aminotransferase